MTMSFYEKAHNRGASGAISFIDRRRQDAVIKHGFNKDDGNAKRIDLSSFM